MRHMPNPPGWCLFDALLLLLLLCNLLPPQGTTDSITMLNNGCLCCTVRDDLVKALNKLWERKDSIDHIIIETTGGWVDEGGFWGLLGFQQHKGVGVE